jgi:hypothetical protein
VQVEALVVVLGVLETKIPQLVILLVLQHLQMVAGEAMLKEVHKVEYFLSVDQE